MVKPKEYNLYAKRAIDSAIYAIEMFNRPYHENRIEMTVVNLAVGWELIGKAYLLKQGAKITNKCGWYFEGEKILNKLGNEYKVISPEELSTLQQIVSLRNESIHGLLPELSEGVLAHLVYYSLKSFHDFVSKHFSSYSPKINRNFLAVSFKRVYTYSHKMSKTLSRIRKISKDDEKELYLLERGLYFAEKGKWLRYDDWYDQLKKSRTKRYPSKDFLLYRYINQHESVVFIPVEAPKGHGANVTISKIKGTGNNLPVHIVKSDPNKDYPYFTSDIAEKLGKNTSFVATLAKKLNIKGQEPYSMLMRYTRSGGRTPKYSDQGLSYLSDYLKKHPDFSPYSDKIEKVLVTE